jgi:hypothetical protein
MCACVRVSVCACMCVCVCVCACATLSAPHHTRVQIELRVSDLTRKPASSYIRKFRGYMCAQS